MKKIFISTAIDYVNAKPHLGHCFEKIQADVIARYFRLQNYDAFFLTGTDENSLKNVQAAKKEGINVKDLVDRNSKIFYELKYVLNLSIDDFIRTTEERNVLGAQKLWKACQKDIYKKTYKGLYCVGCEEFYKEDELVNGLCPEHRTKPELVQEENYFFKLINYQKKLEKIIEQDEVKIIPKTRKNEILSFIKSGLEDVCISRSVERAGGWGIDVPGDSSQKIWVWFDALSNYINALGYYKNDTEFQELWQENKNKIHIIGKGILRFHAIYWPAILLSAGVSLPDIIFVHGYITVDGQKMSKSLGNVIDPFELVKKYGSTSSPQAGTDAVRYYLLREIPSTDDGDFTYEKFETRYNADLAGGIGNLVARVVTIAEKLDSESKITDSQLRKEVELTQEKYNKSLEEFKFNESLKAVWDLIGYCNEYIDREKPWELLANGKEQIANSNKLNEILGDLLYAISHIADLLKPFLPETSEKILKQLKTKKSQPLFPRI